MCKLGETTTVQYKLEFTTQKQIAEELVAFANTRGGIIIFGTEDKTGRMVERQSQPDNRIRSYKNIEV